MSPKASLFSRSIGHTLIQSGAVASLASQSAVLALPLAGLVCLLSSQTALAQQNVFSRSDSNTGDWGSGNLPWFYQTSNNNQGDSDNNNTVRNDVFIGHNNNTTMTVNGRYYIHRDFTFQSATTSQRTINSSGGGGFSFSRKLENASSATHIFNAPVAIDAAGAEISATNGGGLRFNGNVFTNNTQTFIRGNGTVEFLGAMTQGGSFVKQGTGTLSFGQNADFSGSLFIDQGVVKVSRNLSSNAIDIGAGLQANTGFAATLQFDQAVAISKNITVKNVGTGAGDRNLVFANSTGSASLSGTVALEKNLTVSGSGNGLMSGDISGVGGLSMTGAGTVILSGTNSYGTTTISSGTLQIGNGGSTGSLGSGSITNNAALVFNRAGGFGSILNVNSAISGNGTLTQNGANIVSLGVANSYSGATTINSGVLRIAANEGLGTGAAGTTVNSGGQLRLAGVAYTTAEALSINGNGTDTNGALYSIGGTNSSYAGLVTVALNAKIGSIGNTLTLTGGIVNAGTTVTFFGNSTGGVNVDTVGISGAGGNVIVDAATIKMNANNSYTGTTTVSSGMLVVNGNISTSSLTTVNNGATLGGTGTVGPSTIDLGGTMAPGDGGIESLNITGTLTLQTGSISGFEINAATDTADLAIASALLAFGGTLNVTNIGGTLANGDTFDLFDWGSTSGAFSSINLPSLGGGLSWNTSNLYTNGTISIVPEPSAVLLGALGLLALLRRRRA